MPTISREKIKYFGPKGAGEFVREIRVSAIGRFEITLPPDVAEALAEVEVGAYSKTEALKLFDEALKKASTKKAVTKRVICYRILLWGKLARAGKFGEVNPIKHGATSDYDADRRPGVGLQIEVGVFDETMVESVGSKNYRYEEVGSPIPPSGLLRAQELNRRNAAPYGKPPQNRQWDHQMPWTVERESFFVRIVANVEELLIDLHGAFAEEKSATAIADGKRQLLRLK